LLSDPIDPWVGLSDMRHVGATLADDEPVAFVHASDQTKGELAAAMVRKAYKLTDESVEAPALVRELLRGDG
jgi:thymidine phosphorylase